jgi:hypothetical protein
MLHLLLLLLALYHVCGHTQATRSFHGSGAVSSISGQAAAGQLSTDVTAKYTVGKFWRICNNAVQRVLCNQRNVALTGLSLH